MKQTIIPILLLLAFTVSVSAEEQVKIIKNQPSTISIEAKAFLSSWPGSGVWPQMPKSDDINSWKTIQTGIIKSTEQRIKSLIKQYNLTITKNKINHVDVLDIRPKNFKDNGKVLIYIHGGAYTLYDAMSSMGASAVMAEATGLKIISIDYTTAPQSKWHNTLEQTTSVFKGLLEQGYSMEDMAIYGDSAGGALATGTVLKLRNENLGIPSSVVLWSPWADIDTSKGDTYDTLASADPILAIDTLLSPSALAYADQKNFTHPYVSPVYGNYHKGFPPTLIQGGTKEMFLSNFVRLYQKMDIAGIDVKLDLYEGMPHIFQYLMLDTPESQIAVQKSANYILKHLGN